MYVSQMSQYIDVDVVCTGTGISSLFFVYQMIQKGDKRSILFIDQDIRIGGRLPPIEL